MSSRYAGIHTNLSVPAWLSPTRWSHSFQEVLNRLGLSRDLLLGLSIGITFSLTSTGLALWARDRWKRMLRQRQTWRPIEIRSSEIVDGVTGLIGNTPLVRIKSLSELTGVDILGKAEFLNPAGSPKDRVALELIQSAEDAGLLHPNTDSCIYEGTVGSTGISIATVARAKGYQACIIMPDDVAKEKSLLLEKLGAQVQKVRPVSIVDKQHYVNLARSRALHHGLTQLIGPDPAIDPTPAMGYRKAQPRSDEVVTTDADHDAVFHENTPKGHEDDLEKLPRGFFADQFENLANYEAHLKTTGPEIWRQTNGEIDAFVAGAGTGGTLAGVGRYLKGYDDSIKLVLADPQGSGLFNKVKQGVMYASTEAEGKRRRHQVDSIVEGIGINRITRNFDQVVSFIDDAISVTDAEAVAMSRHLAYNDGLFLGSSSAVNLVAAVKYAKTLKGALLKTVSEGRERSVIVTILCDSGARHLSRFWNDEYLTSMGIPITASLEGII
ncbi:uncharacterized protein L969DRAFT_101530 [Mixia osmundae IAM 14324]|uniref:cysteine synthase n=1 Tax=Mixia osmundae (strain CBS 9802 / IAM 14324 / JCM 22182 / KY 12970) TaxID=764103 RepID=G7DXV1_MIXOS|nr:uncharacterized protein L969DRAFT_101530 [Mixia osmundae IAM 14324]KEI41314.1 hypothetical protein L969DRAFT_101530 [Mixia osmundae IAM 14324]GAA95411.1 hypothetical protein E5Q_02065 [Mixia osmundae IAM 14324]